MGGVAMDGSGPRPSTDGPAPASDYDTFVDWERRLGREAPFFKTLFESVAVRTVIDVGAGSGRHAALFAGWGLSVDAVDPDGSMLAQAEENIASAAADIERAGGAVRLLRGGFGQLAELGLGPVDAVTCTGNALPHVDGRLGLRSALTDFAAVLRPGGVLVLHLLNHERLLGARPRTIPPVVRETPEGERVFLRVISYPVPGVSEDVEALDFDFVTLTRDARGEWSLEHRRSLHTALPVRTLAEGLAAAGFVDVEVFGDHERSPYRAESDESVVLVARRG